MMLQSVIKDSINSSDEILEGTMTDLLAAKQRDPSCRYLSEPLLNTSTCLASSNVCDAAYSFALYVGAQDTS